MLRQGSSVSSSSLYCTVLYCTVLYCTVLTSCWLQTQEVEGGYEFECQHGPAECYGNQVQACTIAHAPDYDTTVRCYT